MVVTVVPFDYIGDLKSQQVGYSDHVCLLSEWIAIQMLSTMVFGYSDYKFLRTGIQSHHLNTGPLLGSPVLWHRAS